MKRYILIHIFILTAMVAAWAVVRSSAGRPHQTEAPRASAHQLRTIIFLGDTLPLQIPKGLLVKFGEPNVERYNALHSKQLRSDHATFVAQLDNYCAAHRACDWCRYMLVRAVSEAAFSQSESDERIALQIFLLERMGFDARAALRGTRLVMLLPFDGTVYERNYIEIDGERFYIFEYDSSPDGYTPIARTDTTLRRPLSIEIGAGFTSTPTTSIALPLWSEYLHEPISVPIAMARIELMSHYPTTEKAPFHRAEIPAPLRDTLLAILSRHIAPMSQLDATQFLLGLVQRGFEFTSDSDLFGRHKQMTIEESLFYGRNNCKDRTLIFAWLVDELLDLPTVLVDYQVDPQVENVGHVACGVEFSSSVAGTFITHHGHRFTICDPSYIDAPVGYAMPRYARWPMSVMEL